MSTISDAQRADILMNIEEICKTKGQYLKDKYRSSDEFAKHMLYKYAPYRNSLMNCLSSHMNVMNELVRWAQIDSKVETEGSLKWFKSFLDMIVKAAKHGMLLASKFVKYILRIPVSEGDIVDTLKYNGHPVRSAWNATWSVTGMIIGIIGAVITFAISLWMNATGRTLGRLTRDKTDKQIIKEKLKSTYGEDEDDLEDLDPPDPDIPNVTMSYIHESFNRLCNKIFSESAMPLKEDLAIVAGMFFMLMLKAAISASYNEELEQKSEILRRAIPGKSFATFVALLLLFGAAAGTAL